MTMTGKPSQMAKKLIDLLCENELKDCCCQKISGMWRSKLPREVKTAVAGLALKPDQLEATLRLADSVYSSLQAPLAAAIATVDEVAAVRNTGRGTTPVPRPRTNPPQTAGNNKTTNTNGPRPRGPRHPDGPPENCCSLHWKYGKSAHHCRNSAKCPWKNFTAPPKDTNTNNR